MDLSQYTDEQLVSLRKQIDDEVTSRAQIKKNALVREIREKALEAGLSPDDIIKAFGGRGNKGKPVAVKYRDGDNTWTGRGRKPKWVVEKLESGVSLESLAV